MNGNANLMETVHRARSREFRTILATRLGVAGRLARATPLINLPRQLCFGLR